MSCEWLTCLLVDQLLCISVVSADEHLSVYFFQSLYSLSYTLINCFYSLDRSFLNTCMSYHVRVCKVDHDHIIVLRLDRSNKLVTYFVSAHLRFQVISSNLRGFHKDSVLSLIRLFYSTIEEECYVSIFLCLCNTSLFQSVICKELSKCIRNRFFYECNHLILDCRIILCEAYECSLHSVSSFKSVKTVITECSCELSCSVRTEVEEYNRIIFFDCCCCSTVFCYNKWYYELVCYILIVGSLNSCCCGFCCIAFSCN